MALCTSQLKDMFMIPTPTNLCWTYSSCSFNDDGLKEVDSMVPINTPTPSQENEFVHTMDKYISNSYTLYDSNTYILLYVLISFNAIMIVNILLQILFWTLSISCEIYNSSKIDGSSYPHFYNKLLFHFR